MESKLITILVFAAVYALVATEVLNKAVAALLGATVLLVMGVIDVHTAAGYTDVETIMLMLGMMAIVAVLRKSGFFSILSVRIAKLTGGSPIRILVLFSMSSKGRKMTLIFFFAGLVLLIVGAKALVRGASRLARVVERDSTKELAS